MGHRTPGASNRCCLFALVAALAMLVALPASASAAGTITNFKVERINSLPAPVLFSGPLAPLAPFVPLPVASPLGYPTSDNSPRIHLGAPTSACPPGVNPTGQGAPPTDANSKDCIVYLRNVNGTHEHSPGAFPGLQISADFTGTPKSFTLKLPPGQLGNPFAAHQCTEPDPRNCDGDFPATSLNTDNDPTEFDGSLVGLAQFKTASGLCATALGCNGEILNYDPRALPNPADRTAPAALAIVICAPHAPFLHTCAKSTLAGPDPSIVYAKAAPLFVNPRTDGDYGIDSTIDFDGLDVTSIALTQFGLIPQSPLDPRQPDPTNPTAALPFIFNPTSCVTAVANADASFADTTTSTDAFQMYPRPTTDVAEVQAECSAYPWNHREVSVENSTAHNIQAREQPDFPNGFRGTTKIDHNTKIGSNDDAPVETPSAYQVRFSTPTRAGIPYQSHYKEIAITLKDTTLSPALAGRPGFTVCTPEQFDRGARESANCPTGAKIADLTVLSPLLDGDRGPVPCTTLATCSKVNPFVLADFGCDDPDPEFPCGNLTRRFEGAPGNVDGANLDTFGGDVWSGPQVAGHPNQFRIFAELTDGGVTRIKIAGVATADEQTGEIHAVFDDLPQLPVYHVEQAFPGGDFAPFISPSNCGEHVIPTQLTPWAAVLDGNSVAAFPPKAEPDDKITTSFDGKGAACPAQKPFQPQLSLLSDPFTAGQDASLTTTIKLADRSDNLVATDVALPDGLLGALGTVPLCPRDKARAGDCPATSQIGTVDIQVGNGGAPLHTPGKVYFSEPGASGELARITVVVPAKAGPFDLGTTIINELAVKLRQDGGKIGLDNVGQDKLPTILAGIPIRIRQLDLKIDRERFIRNPLTCDAKTGTGHFESLSGQKVDATAPFTATGCDTLAFTPKVDATIGTAAEPASLDGHPPVSTVVTQPDHEAAIGKAVVSLPQGLNPNVLALSTLCSAAQLTANTCPADSRVGAAKAFSPLLPDPLTGPVYLVENPGGLPKLVIRLGGLLSLDLTGQSLLQGGRLVTTLDGLPATPVSRFELNFTGGPRGLFTVSANLCTGARAIDGSFDSLTGQHATSSRAVNLVGTCAKAAAARRPSLSVRLSRVGKSPRLTVRARAGSSRLSTLRVTIPKGLSVVTKGLRKGVAITAGGKKVTGKQWSLSRSGVLTVRGLPKIGRSSITVTAGGGALQASKKLKRALPRLAFIGRLVDVKGTRYGYTVRVRPTR